MKQFLYFGIVFISLVSCTQNHNPAESLDSFLIDGHKYYAEYAYQLVEDSLFKTKCLKKGDTLIVITENQCIFDNNIWSFPNVNNLLHQYNEYDCSYDTSILPYYFMCTNARDTVLYIGHPVSGIFELDVLHIKDTVLSICNISVGMTMNEFLCNIIQDGSMLVEQKKISVVYVISSHKVNGFSILSSPKHWSDVMIAYFDNDTLSELKLDYIWPTDSSFVSDTPILERF